MSSLDNAIAQMRADGMPEFPPGHPVADGKIHRFGPRGKSESAWYKLHEFRTRQGEIVVVGAYGDWRTGSKGDFHKIEVDWKGISREERADTERRIREAEERERERRHEAAAKAATRARLAWKRAYTIDQARERGLASAYCARKGVTPESCRLLSEDGGIQVLVPMMLYDDGNGARLVGLQRIGEDGAKRFSKGVARVGACCRLGEAPADGDVLLVCEGWATGLSIRMATRHTLAVFVAFDAGGLRPAAEILRARYPASPIVFCADDDWQTQVRGQGPCNVGVEKATAAALAVGNAWVLRPLFREEGRDEKWTDFNDLHLAYGIEEVQRQLDIAGMIAREPPVGGAGIARQEAAPVEDAGGPEPGPDSGAPPDGGDTPPVPGGGDGAGGDPPGGWWAALQRTKEGRIKPSVNNAYACLVHHQDWQGVLGYDTFSEVVWKFRPPPFADGACAGEWTELDDHRLLLWYSHRIGEPGTEAIQKAVQLAAHRQEFNPLRDRLEGLRHDGQARVRTWLRDYLGVCTGAEFERLPQVDQDRMLRYMELAGTKWLVGAVARVFEPGCRVDSMLILEGAQGAMKSTAIEVLGGQWYTDAHLKFEDKDSLLIVQGHWIIEMAELEGMNKADTSATKKFLTQHVDLFRPPYGRKLIQCPRRCIFAGTVNLDSYLKDDSGNRRFWPVRVERIDIDRLRLEVDQLWAEAVALYKAGTAWWPLAAERGLFEEAQEARFDVDVWEDTVLAYLDGVEDVPAHHRDGASMRIAEPRDKVTVPEILREALKLDKVRWDRQAKLRVVGILRRNGWVRRRDGVGSRQWYYVRPAEASTKGVPSPAGDEGGGDDAF